jgi:DNA-binding PadR family transcriptional regulator
VVGVGFSNVAYVILGFLDAEDAAPLSGYDIKQLVDRSVRLFFAASYGQIYPELKRLAAEGMIEQADSASGGRARTTFRITAQGRELLREWLLEPENRVEMRDQGLLRIFFSSSLSSDDRLRKLRELRDERAAGLAALEQLDRSLAPPRREMPDLVLDYGLGLHRYVIDWCDRAIAAIEQHD